jgi:hypothetical protein
MSQEILPSAYAELLEELKQRIRTARIRANLFYMRAFAEAYPDEQFVQQVVGHPQLVNNLLTNCHLEA